MYFQPKVVYKNPNADKKNSIIRYIGNRVLKNNKNFLCALTGCLSKDTKLYGQDKTLAELYNFGTIFVNTLSLTKVKDKPGTYYPIKSKSQIVYSGKKEVFEIELENGKKVYATSEHKFFKKHKHTFKEAEVKDLKIGDSLRDFDIKYLKKFYDKAKQRSQNSTEQKYNPQKICSRCNSLFYVERYSGCKSKLYCNNCSEELGREHRLKKNREDVWYEWEDNLIRQFYYSLSKEKLLELLFERSWSGIQHRARRLGIKRNPILMWKQNAFTSNNNPMNSKDIRDKVRTKLKGKPSKSKGTHIWKDKNHPKGMLGKHHKQKIKEQINNSTLGEKSIHWLGGISFEPYDKNFNKKLKEYIKNRDNNQCCLNNQHKKDLCIHHIDYDKMNSNELNCITLCSRCHAKTNFNRTYWKELLSNMVENKYALLKN